VTQVLGVITQDYALLAADRRLTIGDGPRRGEIVDDDTCKLVSVCNVSGIAYTGLAGLGGHPTHEWIATTLASENVDPSRASHVLKDHASRLFSKLKLAIEINQEFLIAGWGNFQELSGLRPFMRLVTNARDESGKPLPRPSLSFVNLLKVLIGSEPFYSWGIGQPISQSRGQQLERNLHRLARREIGAKAALRLLVDEILNTALVEKNPAVGSKILGLCIPRRSVEQQIGTGRSVMLAKQPDSEVATFTYFEPQFSDLHQYGPTFVCGENAYTDTTTEDDPGRDFQSAQVKILALPKKKP
jgi:hypothetical protein